MSLIKCPECGHDVSDKARTCPHCGYELRPSAAEKATTPQKQKAEEAKDVATTSPKGSSRVENVIEAWKRQASFKGKVAAIFWILFALFMVGAVSIMIYFVVAVIKPMDEGLRNGEDIIALLARVEGYKKQCVQYRNAMLALFILAYFCAIFANLWTPLQSAAWAKKNHYDFAAYFEATRDTRSKIRLSSTGTLDWTLYCCLSPKSKTFYVIQWVMLGIGGIVFSVILSFMFGNLGATVVDSYLEYGWVDIPTKSISIPLIVGVIFFAICAIPKGIYTVCCRNFIKLYPESEQKS